jgi:hypothetical protein
MVASTNSSAVCRLGKKLVQELQLEPGVDTLAKWMAHYIAELMAEAQAAPPERADAVQAKCFETILALWRHQAEEGRIRPQLKTHAEMVELFGRFLHADEPFYFRHTGPLKNELLEEARQIDSAARAIIHLLLSQASERAGDRERGWIDLARGLPADAQGNLPAVIVKFEEKLKHKRGKHTEDDPVKELLDKARGGIKHFQAVLRGIKKGVDNMARVHAETKKKRT